MANELLEAAIAAHRFGLGPRRETLAAIASDPRGALISELRPEMVLISDAKLLSAGEAERMLFRRAEALKVEKRKGEQVGAAEKSPKKNSNEAKMAGSDKGDQVNPNVLLLREAQARFDVAFEHQIGFVDRLTWFWSNHFCVSTDKSVMRAFAGPFEREAIRPHVLGRFVDMLLAVEQHPAMLAYLDNIRSIGPRSRAASKEGKKDGKGLNENLAREILELHTLGVRAGYTQADVTSLAKVITGWTMSPRNTATGGEFIFDESRHEPGPQTVLGKVYPEAGVGQGISVLRDIAANPATARHISQKFVRHFIADEPPPALVDRIVRTFQESNGDLKEMAIALISAPEAFKEPRPKLKRPAEWMTAVWRGVGTRPDMLHAIPQMTALGEPLWKPPAPKGFPDDSAAWGVGLPARVDFASEFAMNMDKTIDARAVLEVVLGPLASAETRRTIAGADSQAQGLALLFMSPEFQRR
jgi:uncharacterized protein (DUF1800 family)